MTPPDGPILIVDDDPKIVQLVRAYLEREGFPVVTAADGRAALAAIHEHGPRLIVLDLMLPAAELRLLIALIEADGRVLTRESLLDALYGQDASETLDRTVDVYVGRLREKLGDDPERARYIAIVRGAGYRAVVAR